MEQKVFFSNSNGLQLCGILSDPKKDFSKPLIVYNHGFGSSKNTAKALRLEKDLNAIGLGTFRFDFLGHGESEGELENMTISEGVDNALRALQKLETLGYTQFGLVGESFGVLTSLIASTQDSKIRFLICIAPLFNYQEKEIEKIGLEKIQEWKEKGVREYTKHNGKVIQLKYDLFEDAGKYNGYEFAKKVKIPVFIVQGRKDTLVPVTQSLKIKEIIPTCELHILPNADHYLKTSETFEEVIQLVEKFIEKQVQKFSN